MPAKLNIEFNMVQTKVTKIGGTLFVRIPAEEAKRLGLEHGSTVDVQVRPLGRKVRDMLKLKGKFKGQLAPFDRKEMWGDYGE